MPHLDFPSSELQLHFLTNFIYIQYVKHQSLQNFLELVNQTELWQVNSTISWYHFQIHQQELSCHRSPEQSQAPQSIIYARGGNPPPHHLITHEQLFLSPGTCRPVPGKKRYRPQSLIRQSLNSQLHASQTHSHGLKHQLEPCLIN